MNNEFKELIIKYQETKTPAIKKHLFNDIKSIVEDYGLSIFTEYLDILNEYRQFINEERGSLPLYCTELLEKLTTNKTQRILLQSINNLDDIQLKFGYYVCSDNQGNILCCVKEDYFDNAKRYFREQILKNFEDEFQLVETYGLLNSLVIKYGTWVTSTGLPENEYKEMLKKCFVKINELI